MRADKLGGEMRIGAVSVCICFLELFYNVLLRIKKTQKEKIKIMYSSNNRIGTSFYAPYFTSTHPNKISKDIFGCLPKPRLLKGLYSMHWH